MAVLRWDNSSGYYPKQKADPIKTGYVAKNNETLWKSRLKDKKDILNNERNRFHWLKGSLENTENTC